MEHPLSAFCLRAQKGVIAIAVAGSALIVWRSPSDAYSLPKATFAVMAAVVVLALTAVRAIVRRRADIPVGLVPVGMAVVVACMVAATLASQTSAVSALGPPRYTGLLLYVAYLVIGLAAMAAFRDGKPMPVLAAILVAGTVQVAYGLVQTFGWQPLPFGAFTTPVFGTLGNSNFLSGWLGITAPVALWAALDPLRTPRARIAFGALVLGCLVVIWRSSSFQGLPAAAAGLLLMTAAWLGTPAGQRIVAAGRERIRSARGYQLVAGASALLILGGAAAVKVTALALQNIGAGGAARLEYWSAARRLVLDHPVLGTGPGTFVQHYASYYQPTGAVAYELTNDPHSVPLAMFTSGGFVLGTAYLAFVALTGFVLLRGLRRTDGSQRSLLGALGGAWIAYQVQSVVSIDVPALALTHWVLAASIACAAGALTFPLEPEEAPAPKGRPKPRSRRPRLSKPAGIAAGAVVMTAVLLLVVTTRPMRAAHAANQADDLIAANRPEEALDQAKRAVALAPWDDRHWWLYGRAQERTGDFEEAEEAAERAAALAPSDPGYALILANLALRRGDADPALRWSLHAARVAPRDPVVLAKVARNLVTLDRRDEAERMVREALTRRETPDLWAVLGLSYALEGDEERAIDAYLRAFELRPTHAEARAFLEARNKLPV